MEEGDHDDVHMFETTSNKGYGMSGSAMGESFLMSSISQPDGESTHGKGWLQQWTNRDGGDGQMDHGVYPYPLNRHMRIMLDSLRKDQHLHAESSLRKDRELEEHPDTDAMFDRLTGTFHSVFLSSIKIICSSLIISSFVYSSPPPQLF